MQISTPTIPTGWKTFEARTITLLVEGNVQISHYFSNDVPLVAYESLHNTIAKSNADKHSTTAVEASACLASRAGEGESS